MSKVATASTGIRPSDRPTGWAGFMSYPFYMVLSSREADCPPCRKRRRRASHSTEVAHVRALSGSSFSPPGPTQPTRQAPPDPPERPIHSCCIQVHIHGNNIHP